MGQITDNKLGGVINFHNTIVKASSSIGRKESFVRDCAIHRNGSYVIAALNYTRLYFIIKHKAACMKFKLIGRFFSLKK